MATAASTIMAPSGDGNHVDDRLGVIGKDGGRAGEQVRRNLACHDGHAEKQRQAHGEPLVAAFSLEAVGSVHNRILGDQGARSTVNQSRSTLVNTSTLRRDVIRRPFPEFPAKMRKWGKETSTLQKDWNTLGPGPCRFVAK